MFYYFAASLSELYMDQDQKFNFYKEIYFSEIEQKQHLTRNTRIPLTFLTAVYTVYAFFISNFSSLLVSHFTFIIFLLFGLTSLYFTIKSTYYLYKALAGGFEYFYLTSANEMLKHELLLAERMKSDGTYTPELLDKIFFAQLKGKITEATTKNQINNKGRSKLLVKSIKNTIFRLVLTFAATVPFFINLAQKA